MFVSSNGSGIGVIPPKAARPKASIHHKNVVMPLLKAQEVCEGAWTACLVLGRPMLQQIPPTHSFSVSPPQAMSLPFASMNVSLCQGHQCWLGNTATVAGSERSPLT